MTQRSEKGEKSLLLSKMPLKLLFSLYFIVPIYDFQVVECIFMENNIINDLYGKTLNTFSYQQVIKTCNEVQRKDAFNVFPKVATNTKGYAVTRLNTK